MRILMVIVVEDRVRLPRLPPLRLKRNARVVQNAVVENVQSDRIEHRCANTVNIIKSTIDSRII